MSAVPSAMLQRSGGHYLDEFLRHRDTLPGRDLPWLTNLREQAMQRFVEMGFPTLRSEDWKYTNVAPIEKARFSLAPETSPEIGTAEIDALALPGAHLIVFVDGRYVPALSRLEGAPAGLTVMSIAALLESRPDGLPAQFGDAGDYPSAFSALNAACMTDGACVHVAKGSRIEAPIHMLFIGAKANLAFQTRNLIVAEPDSHACIVEHHAASGSPSYFTNTVTDIVIARGAAIDHHKLQQESPKAYHVASVNVEQDSESRFVSTSFGFGAALARTDISVELNGEGAECTLDGLYMADGRRHVDHHTRVDHNQPHGTSRELYKGVLDGGGRAVFNGRVIVHPGAQKSDATQINRNLLLSALAEIDTKPQLEIWADDVKCSHAATVGQLDAEHVFYLRSRGLDEAAARALLIYGFASETVERVEQPSLRERLDGILRAWLPQELEVLP